MLFADVLAAFYGPNWRQTAPQSLRRSRRTLSLWAVDDSRVPPWAWEFFADEQLAEGRWRSIDRRAVEEQAKIAVAAEDQKNRVSMARRLAERRLEQLRYEPVRRVGRPRLNRQPSEKRLRGPSLKEKVRSFKCGRPAPL